MTFNCDMCLPTMRQYCNFKGNREIDGIARVQSSTSGRGRAAGWETYAVGIRAHVAVKGLISISLRRNWPAGKGPL